MTAHQRIHGFDAIRGIAVVSMIGFHGVYDLVNLYGMALPWFSGWFEDFWRASISWTFLILAGRMFSLSHNDLRRAAKYLLVAALIFVVTSVVAVDIPISFGIMFCMGASTLLYWGLQKLGWLPQHLPALVALAVVFLLTLRLPQGSLGLGAWTVDLPSALYESEWFSWLGFPGPQFVSGDYYPLLPFSLLYGVGVAWGYVQSPEALPQRFLSFRCAPLEVIGRHSLLIYVVHQPLLLGLFSLFAAGGLLG